MNFEEDFAQIQSKGYYLNCMLVPCISVKKLLKATIHLVQELITFLLDPTFTIIFSIFGHYIKANNVT